MTHTALKIAKDIDSLGVIDLHTIPFNISLIDVLRHANKIITMEEHMLNGGIGDCMCSFLSDNNIHKNLLRIGIKNSDGYCYKYGGRKEVIWKHYGIDSESSIKNISNFLDN